LDSVQEIQQVLDKGADLILLPMIKSPTEVKKFLSILDGRAQSGILIETVEAVSCAEQIANLTVDVIYVGLFDLSLSRNDSNIFKPLVDGTVEKLRNVFKHESFGVGGLTTVDSGYPVPCLQLMSHLTRLKCDFTFLRNSFKKDIQNKDINQEICSIRNAWDRLSNDVNYGQTDNK
jgi:2-keto-3-deoxy-L-rhamnonate aldolase RhmA